jgi:hypothetical protein
VYSTGYGAGTSSNQATLNATGWYRVWTYSGKDTVCNHVLLYIEKTYSGSASEAYTVDITIASNGAATLTQIGGHTHSSSVQNITKVRYNYTYNTSGSVAIDIYYSGTSSNPVRVYGFCGKGAFQAPTAVETTYNSSKELDLLRNAVRTSGNFVAQGYVSAGGVSSSSDARLKTDLKNIDLTVDQIADAPAVTFKWKNETTSPRHAGSLAQYWAKVMPEVVGEVANHLTLDYGATALLSSITIAKAVKNHEERIKELEEENKQLKAKVYALE